MTSTKKKGIVFLSTFPPRACGIATYTTDLMRALSDQFGCSYDQIAVPIESDYDGFAYEFSTDHVLHISDDRSFDHLLNYLNTSSAVDLICIQHEFGLFKPKEELFLRWLSSVQKKTVLTFHTVLPSPQEHLLAEVRAIADVCSRIIVMTQDSANILVGHYDISPDKIAVVPHGTHLAPAIDKVEIRERYALTGRKVLSTFGLLGPGKSIETTLSALPNIIEKTPEVIFLVLGMTHPTLLQEEGERYRDMLEQMVDTNGLSAHVRFVNQFLSTEDLLSYLLVTDVYLFTSQDPLQAVSGTFAYALSTGCPVVSTPIPHVREVLTADMGIMINFNAPLELADAVNKIVRDSVRLEKIRHTNIQQTVATSWPNTAIAHMDIFEKLIGGDRMIIHSLPPINLDHIHRMTTDIGFVQFAHISSPDLDSGYALDDNARALLAILYHYRLYNTQQDLTLIQKYLSFIARCMQEDGTFLNYIDRHGHFTAQNEQENLEDANGRAIWALGELVGMSGQLPKELTDQARELIARASVNFLRYHSTRSMAFTIKGLSRMVDSEYLATVEVFADRLVAMFTHESEGEWSWYESYLTYGNSTIPEAMLSAYQLIHKPAYEITAYKSFDFLLDKIFVEDRLQVISNKGWAYRDQPCVHPKGGEQPIDVAYTVIALDRFYSASKDTRYREQLLTAFDWFLGRNHLRQMIYNPVTGGCFDGLEEHVVNINQGAESTLSYLLARLTMNSYT